MKNTIFKVMACVVCVSLSLLCLYFINVSKDNDNNTSVEYMHISVDDTVHCFENLADNSYQSLFDEPFFNKLKILHDEYGAKFSLYTYTSVLEKVSDKYKSEFTASAGWLKVGFHSISYGFILKDATYSQGLQYWNDFVSNVERVCGSVDSLDRLPRLEHFSGSHQALLGMRDANCGAKGFLSADDNRLSYYFDSEMMENLYDSDYLKDEDNKLLFLSTDFRIDWFYNFTSNNKYKAPKKGSVYDELVYRNEEGSFKKSLKSLIVFMHEWLVYDGSSVNAKFDSVKDACEFADKYNIGFDFAQNRSY